MENIAGGHRAAAQPGQADRPPPLHPCPRGRPLNRTREPASLCATAPVLSVLVAPPGLSRRGGGQEGAEVTRPSQTWPQGNVLTKPALWSQTHVFVHPLGRTRWAGSVPRTPVTGTRGRGNRKHGRSLPQAQEGARAGARTVRTQDRESSQSCQQEEAEPRGGHRGAGWLGRPVQLWPLRRRPRAARAPDGTLWTPAVGLGASPTGLLVMS